MEEIGANNSFCFSVQGKTPLFRKKNRLNQLRPATPFKTMLQTIAP
jgi:hypothetical protein